MRRGRECLASLAICFVSLMSVGCQARQADSAERTVPVEIERRLSDLDQASSRDDFERAFGTKGGHQFTVRRDGARYRCLSYLVEDTCVQYYAVFKDGRLDRLVEPPAFATEVVRIDGANVERRKPWVTEDRITSVLGATNLLEGGLVQSVRRRYPRPSQSSSFFPGIVVLAPIDAMGRLFNLGHERRCSELQRRYDPLRVPLGASRASFEALFSEPDRRVLAAKDTVVEVFGYDSDPKFKSGVDWRMAVVFKGDQAVAVLSDDFFNENLLASPG